MRGDFMIFKFLVDVLGKLITWQYVDENCGIRLEGFWRRWISHHVMSMSSCPVCASLLIFRPCTRIGKFFFFRLNLNLMFNQTCLDPYFVEWYWFLNKMMFNYFLCKDRLLVVFVLAVMYCTRVFHGTIWSGFYCEA